MPNIFLYQGAASQYTVILSDPTILRPSGGSVTVNVTGSSITSVVGSVVELAGASVTVDVSESVIISNTGSVSVIITPPVPPPPPIILGETLNSSGVSSTNPSVIITALDSVQLFPLPTKNKFLSVSGGGVGNTFLPSSGGYSLFHKGSNLIAQGYVSVPSSVVDATVNLVLILNAIQNPRVPLVALQSDVMATLPVGQPIPTGITKWSLICRLSEYQQRFYGSTKIQGQMKADYTIKVGNASFSGTSCSSNDPFLAPASQFSIGVQFSGSVDGTDAFQASLFQFETQK